MKSTSPLSATMDAIALEHEFLASFYERILDVLQSGPRKLLRAAEMLDELVERIAEHFAHEEEGGYFSEVVELAPWRSTELEVLRREHSDLLNCAAQITRNVRMASGSKQLCDLLSKDFAEFLRRCLEHEATENRLVQEVYSLDIAAAD